MQRMLTNIELTKYQIYLIARNILLAQMNGMGSRRYTEKQIEAECRISHFKIWRDAFEDALTISKSISNNLLLWGRENANPFMKVISLNRIDYMSKEEFEKILNKAAVSYCKTISKKQTDLKSLDFVEKYLNQPDVFICRVQGENMQNLNITNESVLIVQKTKHILSGNIVIANINDELLVKRYLKAEGRVILKSEYENCPDIICNEDKGLIIWGRVELIIHPSE